VETKTCRTCLQRLPFDAFHSNGGSNKNGQPRLKSDCKACYSAARSSTMLPLDARKLTTAFHDLRERELCARVDEAVMRVLVRHGIIADPMKSTNEKEIMKNSIVVYGQQACGKTRNAERIRKHLGLNRIIDDWDGKRAPYERKAFDADAGILYLTSMTREELMALKVGSLWLASFEEVAQQINAAIPLTDWQNSKPQHAGEYIASSFRDGEIRRWWNGKHWSFMYVESDSQEQKNTCAGIPGPINGIQWRGLAEEPIVVLA
jgi:hypothetical protein